MLLRVRIVYVAGFGGKNCLAEEGDDSLKSSSTDAMLEFESKSPTLFNRLSFQHNFYRYVPGLAF